MCLAQGPQRSDAGEARTHGPSVKHSTTEPLRSQNGLRVITIYKPVNFFCPKLASPYLMFLWLLLTSYNSLTMFGSRPQQHEPGMQKNSLLTMISIDQINFHHFGVNKYRYIQYPIGLLILRSKVKITLGKV